MLKIASVVFVLALSVFATRTVLSADRVTTSARVGVLLPGIPNKQLDGFREGMRELGYVEGKNLVIEERWAMGKWDDVPRLAKELVNSKVDVIVTATARAALALREATHTTPIILAAGPDPVRSGLVASLARPGGNITGLTIMLEELSAKRLEVLKEIAPRTTHVAVLHDTWASRDVKSRMEAAGRTLGIRLEFLLVSTPRELDSALQRIATGRYDALVVFEEANTVGNATRIVQAANALRLPGIYGGAVFVQSGGLASYGPSLSGLFKRAAWYVDRVLKGANPGDIPIEQPTKFELIVNVTTAKALGVTIPQAILLRADQVIQ